MFIKLPYKIVILLTFFIITGCDKTAPTFYEKSTSKQFTDVLQDIEFIITEYNFRITGRLHIGEAIQDRGIVDFPDNEVILFCNLSLAEDMLKIEPQYINYCPYKIAVFVKNNEIVLSTHLLPESTDNVNLDNIAKKINIILRSMIEYVASNDPFNVQPNTTEILEYE